jgi:hypothetical protein
MALETIAEYGEPDPERDEPAAQGKREYGPARDSRHRRPPRSCAWFEMTPRSQGRCRG